MGFSSLVIPWASWELNSRCQVWWQAPLLAEASHRLSNVVLDEIIKANYNLTYYMQQRF